MLTQQRKQYILEALATEGQVIAKTLAQRWEVSEDTIRRDLRELAKEGLLQRVHGGALPASAAISNFSNRQHIAIEEKSLIAKSAIDLIQPGQTIFLDGGTTTLQLAHQLPADLNITVVTHSPTIAVELVAHPQVEVVLLGGRLFKHSVVTVGAVAMEAVAQRRTDLYFMGVTGIHPTFGFTTGDMEEACMKRAISRQAAETIVMASSEKIGVVSPCLIMPLSEASSIILGAEVADEVLEPYSTMGVNLIRISAK